MDLERRVKYRAKAFHGLWPMTQRLKTARRARLFDMLTPFVNILRLILSFASPETERVFRAEFSRRLPPDIQRSARRKLLASNAATEIRQMAVQPGTD
jgi:hypothetical protein